MRLHQAFGVLVIVALIAVPAASFLVGRVRYDAEAAHNRAAATAAHPVTGVLEQDVYAVAGSMRTGAATAKVSWTAADGTTRTGQAPVQTIGSRGDQTVVWLDRAGNPVEPPAPPGRAMSHAIGSGLATLVGGAAALLALLGSERFLFMRRRTAAWARDWERTAPRWARA
ncbi:hypothetical protein QI554_01460 [Yinghuangia seranimata]|nr:hypothetical protein [Yinghuangia seranimata]MDI2124802.1 hypothetical protein [Yinghuangia seranimata]